MAEIEEFFLQNTAVAAALLEDAAAQPLREKLLAALAASGGQSRRRSRIAEGIENAAEYAEENAEENVEENAEENVEENAAENENAAKTAKGRTREYAGNEADTQPARALLERMTAQERTAVGSGDSDGTRAAHVSAPLTESLRIRTDETEETQETQEMRAPDNSATVREAGDVPEANAEVSRRNAESHAQWETAPDAARLLLAALGEEGLSSTEPALTARLVRAQQGADAATGVSRQEENPPAQVRDAAADRLGQAENSGEAGDRGAFAAPYSVPDGRGSRAEAETDGTAAESGQKGAHAPGAGVQTGKAGGSEEKSGTLAFFENRNTEISGRDRMAEISRFFERDARRYGQ